MTTVVSSRDIMASDRLVTYGPNFSGDCKIWIARQSIWGAAGSNAYCSAFRAWTLGKGRRPSFTKPDEDEEDDDAKAKLEVLQLSHKGLFLWINGDLPEPINESFYAIGSGAPYAMGAMSMGATVVQAVEIATRWDGGSRMPLDAIALADMKKKKRG